MIYMFEEAATMLAFWGGSDLRRPSVIHAGAGLCADQRGAGPKARALHILHQAEGQGGHHRGGDHAAATESGPATAGVGKIQ